MPAQTAGTLSGYAMDRYDGGRAACEPEHFTRTELGWAVRPHSEPDDDVRTLALAIIALTHCSD